MAVLAAPLPLSQAINPTSLEVHPMLPTLFLAPMILLGSPASVQAPIQNTMDTRTEDAVNLAKAMIGDLLEAQRKVITRFKALPESDDIRMNFGRNMYGWSVSEKALSNKREDYETSLAAYQKDFKDTALVDELRLYAKKIVRNSQDNLPKYEARIANAQKLLRDGKLPDKDGKPMDLSDADRKSQEGLVKILPLEIEFLKDSQKLASAYAARLTKLMD